MFTRVRLGDQKVIKVHTELARIERIQRVFGVDEGTDAAILLGFCHAVQGQRRLARAFRTIDFDDTALGQAANAERNVEAERTGGHRFDIHHLLVAKAHDRALAEGPLNIAQSCFKSFLLVHA